MSWLKRRLPRKRWKRIVLYVLSTILMLVAMDMVLVQYLRRVAISPETTGIVSPLTPTGMPDYIGALNQRYSEGVTAENNAAALLWRLLGTGDMPAEWRETVMPYLGLPTEVIAPGTISSNAWMKSHSLDDNAPSSEVLKTLNELDLIVALPWKGVDHPLWAEWLDMQRDALRMAREAVERPRYYVPLVRGHPFAIFEPSSPYHGLWEILKCSAMRNAGEGDMAAARRDILTLMRLARLKAQGPTILDYLVAIGIDSIASRAVIALAQRGGAMPPGEAREMLAAMEKLAPMPRPDGIYDREMRWALLNNLCYGAEFGAARLEALWTWDRQISAAHDPTVPEPGLSVFTRIAALVAPVRFNEALRETNHLQDEIVSAMRLSTFEQRRTALRAIGATVAPYAKETRLLLSSHPAYAVMSGDIRSWENVITLGERSLTQHDLARVALALAIYRGEHGVYPEALSSLVPGILERAPQDAFSNAPLVYQREQEGYVLYSVGPENEGEKETGPNWRVVRGK